MHEEDFRPLFIVGYPRSGTTLLASQLVRHGNVAIPPETRFFEEVLQPIAMGPRTHLKLVKRFQGNIRCKDLQLDTEALLDRFQKYSPSYPNLLRAALEEFAFLQGRENVGEKTPIHLMYVDTILQWYPEAKIVAIVRDGRDAVLSLMRVPWAHNDLARHCSDWVARMGFLKQLLQRYPDQIHIARYEDLLGSSDSLLNEVFLFANIKPLTGVGGDSKASLVVPKWEAGWKSNAVEALDPSRIAAWRRDASPEQICCMHMLMSDALQAWGYEVEPSNDSTLTMRCKFRFLRVLYGSWLYRIPRFLIHGLRRQTGRFPSFEVKQGH